MKGFYDNSLYKFDEPQPSYWEATAPDPKLNAHPLQSDERCDVAVIGAGYTGLSAAYHLAQDNALDIRVLDAGHIGWGASGRNGGFCCIGGTKMAKSKQISQFGLDETRRYFQMQATTIDYIRELTKAENIDIQPQGNCSYSRCGTSNVNLEQF